MDRIEQKVFSCVKEVLETATIDKDQKLIGENGTLDSVTALRLIILIEEEFGISFDDDLLLESLESVDSLIAFVKQSVVS